MPFDIDVLDLAERQIERLEAHDRGVPMEELFPPAFMREHTEFGSFDELLAESPWTVESQADFEAIPEGEFDEYLDEHTVFSSWGEMYEVGSDRYYERKLLG